VNTSPSKRFLERELQIDVVWLNGIFADKIIVFVDEDKSCKESNPFNKPILSPAEVPNGSAVYLALIPKVEKRISTRL
jgi:hypothetical protein